MVYLCGVFFYHLKRTMIMRNENVFCRRLSRHFTVGDLARTGEAVRRGIDNVPSEGQIGRLGLLCERLLEPLRCRFGDLHLVAGYRSRRLHEALGGRGSALHLHGEAVCLHVSSDEVGLRMCRFVEERLEFDVMWVSGRMRNGCRLLMLSFSGRRRNRGIVKIENLTKKVG